MAWLRRNQMLIATIEQSNAVGAPEGPRPGCANILPLTGRTILMTTSAASVDTNAALFP